VDPHVGREATGVAAAFDRLVGDVAAGQFGARRQPGFLRLGRDADGVMSGVPVMFSRVIEVVTVSWPLAPITIEAIPNAIRTRAATTPLIFQCLAHPIPPTQWFDWRSPPQRPNADQGLIRRHLSPPLISAVSPLNPAVRDRRKH
jgi:hypothetical protein